MASPSAPHGSRDAARALPAVGRLPPGVSVLTLAAVGGLVMRMADPTNFRTIALALW